MAASRQGSQSGACFARFQRHGVDAKARRGELSLHHVEEVAADLGQRLACLVEADDEHKRQQRSGNPDEDTPVQHPGVIEGDQRPAADRQAVG